MKNELAAKIILVALVATAFVSGYFVGKPDDPGIPKYGKLGLPANCSAYVEVSVVSWERKTYPTEDIFGGLMRNCGPRGNLWYD